MGETVQLNSPLAGQFSLNDFLAQQNNRVTPADILRTIVPVQEMRGFQRRYFFDTGSQALVAGERISLLRWTVPEGEWWKPLGILYQNADSVAHSVLVTFSMVRSPAAVVWQAVKTLVSAVGTEIIYGADELGAVSGIAGRFISRIPVVMEPRDTIDLRDNTGNAGASQQRWIFAYERVPQPATERTAGVVGVVTVVP